MLFEETKCSLAVKKKKKKKIGLLAEHSNTTHLVQGRATTLTLITTHEKVIFCQTGASHPLVLILCCTILGVGGGWWVGNTQTPLYEIGKS
jgi:hypothetical protein